MRWLYKILRLFFCPHRFKRTNEIHLLNGGKQYGTKYVGECRYCGKIKGFKV